MGRTYASRLPGATSITRRCGFSCAFSSDKGSAIVQTIPPPGPAAIVRIVEPITRHRSNLHTLVAVDSRLLVQPLSEHPTVAVRRPVMYQRWDSLTFLHWAYEPGTIRPLVPPELELDTFDGAAWIGLTPFLLTGLRPPLFPPFPWISRFPEMNVRTYVRDRNGDRGIWFFTLEADRLLGVLGARISYCLPYRWAKMSVRPTDRRIEYRSERYFRSGRARIVVLRNSLIQPDEQAIFLTARFRLYTKIAGRLAFAQVDHPAWPLESGTALELEQDVIQNSNVPPPSGKPLVHFSPGVDVRIGRPKLLR